MVRASRLVAVLLICACAHKKPPPPPPPAPPPPKGDTLRFKAKPGDVAFHHAKVMIEIEGPASDKRGKPSSVSMRFQFGEEESVEAVAPDGSYLVTARLVDAVGETPAGGNQELVDDMALAFGEIKVRFKRQPRGDVAGLGLSGMRTPLEEPTARQVMNAMFGAQRGALFPEAPVDVGGTWKVALPAVESSGLTGEVRYDYTYARKEGGVAVIGAEGRFDGTKKEGPSDVHVSAKTSTELHFDLSGRMLASTVDQLTIKDTSGADKGTLKQHLRVEWTADKQ